MAIVHGRDNRTGIVYVYESHSYWDKEAKKYKAHRKLLGKLDENGKLVPTGKRGRPKKERSTAAPKTPEDYTLQEALDKARADMAVLQTRYDEDLMGLYKENDELRQELHDLRRRYQSLIDQLQDLVRQSVEP